MIHNERVVAAAIAFLAIAFCMLACAMVMPLFNHMVFR